MDDRNIMENLLLTTKGVCDLYLHGTIESATPNVHGVFQNALTDALSMQSDIYAGMSEKGWYPTQKAETQQVRQVKEKYSQQTQGA